LLNALAPVDDGLHDVALVRARPARRTPDRARSGPRCDV